MHPIFLIVGIVSLASVLCGCGSSPTVASRKPMQGTAATARAGETPRSARDLVPAVVGIPNDAAVAASHQIAQGDVLDIKVFQVDDLTTQERVNDAGAVILPLIGPVRVAGLTTEQAEQTIASALAKDYLQDPQVDVFVSEYADQEVTVGGEVEKPGVFPLRGQTTLLEAIALAGGTTNLAKESEVIVFRTTRPTDSISAYVVDLKKVERGELGDPQLVANDKIVVPKSGSRAFISDVTSTLRGFISMRAITF